MSKLLVQVEQRPETDKHVCGFHKFWTQLGVLKGANETVIELQ